MFTRGHPDDPAMPSFVESDEASKFFKDTFNCSVWDVVRKYELWSCNHDKTNNRNDIDVVRNQITVLVEDALRKITGDKTVTMSWANYKIDIVHTHGVEMAGWPSTVVMVRPSKMAANAARRILDKLRRGAIHWVALTRSQRAEVAEEVEALRESGAVKQRKQRSDKTSRVGRAPRRAKRLTPMDPRTTPRRSQCPCPLPARPISPRPLPVCPMPPRPLPMPNTPTSAPRAPNVPTSAPRTPNTPASIAQALNTPASAAQAPNAPVFAAQAPNAPASITQAPTAPPSATQAPNAPAFAFQPPNAPASATQAPSAPASAARAPIAEPPPSPTRQHRAALSTGMMPFGSQLADDLNFDFVGMDFGPMPLFPSSSSTSQLGLSTDQLNDGVTMRINTSNCEDFAFDGGFNGGGGVAGDPSPSFAYNLTDGAPSAQVSGGAAGYMGATNNMCPGTFIPAIPHTAPASGLGVFMSVFSVATNTVTQKRKRAEGDGVEKPARKVCTRRSWDSTVGADTDTNTPPKHHLKCAPEAVPPP
ncbi:hypothetical protein B0H14DRAFT_3439801 [Mycena olivaceomarginata]|nr:hypothetical protein B0H14DRAFT_3439801 [Mycena olivaceomarginata]